MVFLLLSWTHLIPVQLPASASVLDMHLCNYYIPELRDCGNRDFLSTSYYATALPVIGLFALGQTRIFSLAGTVLWLALVAGAIFPARPAFVRNCESSPYSSSFTSSLINLHDQS